MKRGKDVKAWLTGERNMGILLPISLTEGKCSFVHIIYEGQGQEAYDGGLAHDIRYSGPL